MMQLLDDIRGRVFASLRDLREAPNQSTVNTELTHYRHVAALLDIVFRGTHFEKKE